MGHPRVVVGDLIGAHMGEKHRGMCTVAQSRADRSSAPVHGTGWYVN